MVIVEEAHFVSRCIVPHSCTKQNSCPRLLRPLKTRDNAVAEVARGQHSQTAKMSGNDVRESHRQPMLYCVFCRRTLPALDWYYGDCDYTASADFEDLFWELHSWNLKLWARKAPSAAWHGQTRSSRKANSEPAADGRGNRGARMALF